MSNALQALNMLTGLEAVESKCGRTFTYKHPPTGFVFAIGPSGTAPSPGGDEEEDVQEELMFQPLELGAAVEVRKTPKSHTHLPILGHVNGDAVEVGMVHTPNFYFLIPAVELALSSLQLGPAALQPHLG
jgi:hypothetical protein